jgi:hypothetical protein
MTPDAALALTLDALLAEHRKCWRLTGDGLTSTLTANAVQFGCPCGALLAVNTVADQSP